VSKRALLDRLRADREAKRQRAAGEFIATLGAPDGDEDSLEVAAILEEAFELTTKQVLGDIADNREEADECERQAKALEREAKALDPGSQPAKIEAKRVAADELWRQRGAVVRDLIVAGAPEADIRAAEAKRDAASREIHDCDVQLTELRDRAFHAEQLRNDGARLAARAAELREDAARWESNLSDLPEIIARGAPAVRAEFKRRRELARESSAKKPKQLGSEHRVLVPIGNGLLQDTFSGVIYNGRGYPVVVPNE
jgi:hypothetical protein